MKCKHCQKQKDHLNSEGYCNAACQRERGRMQTFYAQLSAILHDGDRRMTISVGQACRAHGEQLAKDAEIFAAEKQEGLALDFSQRSKWLLQLAEEIESGPPTSLEVTLKTKWIYAS